MNDIVESAFLPCSLEFDFMARLSWNHNSSSRGTAVVFLNGLCIISPSSLPDWLTVAPQISIHQTENYTQPPKIG